MPPPKKVYRDEWGTGSYEAYEDKPRYQRRVKVRNRAGNGFLRALGGLMMVAGIFWGTYVLSSGGSVDSFKKFPSPLYLCGGGVVVSILGKYLG